MVSKHADFPFIQSLSNTYDLMFIRFQRFKFGPIDEASWRDPDIKLSCITRFLMAREFLCHTEDAFKHFVAKHYMGLGILEGPKYVYYFNLLTS